MRKALVDSIRNYSLFHEAGFEFCAPAHIRFILYDAYRHYTRGPRNEQRININEVGKSRYIGFCKANLSKTEKRIFELGQEGMDMQDVSQRVGMPVNSVARIYFFTCLKMIVGNVVFLERQKRKGESV